MSNHCNRSDGLMEGELATMVRNVAAAVKCINDTVQGIHRDIKPGGFASIIDV